MLTAVPIEHFTSFGRKIIAFGLSYKHNWPAEAIIAGSKKPEPLLFIKPPSTYTLQGGRPLEVPSGCEVHHEVELAIVIGKEGRDLPISSAESYIAGYALALDMTAKNVQAAERERRIPWTISKGLDTFTPISDFISCEALGDPHDVYLELDINGKEAQRGHTSNLLYPIAELISYASSIMSLERGDVILTGSPPNVGPVKVGDRLSARLLKGGTEKRLLTSIDIDVVQRKGALYQYPDVERYKITR